MADKRILSLWFPRLGAERLLRRDPALALVPFAVVRDRNNMQQLDSLSAEAEAAGLRPGQPLRDAQAMCPALVTRLANEQAERDFLIRLRRWAGKYSPWVSDQPPASLLIDLTGSAHLFGGEEMLLETVQDDCARLGLTVCGGIADTVGAAWALARYAGQPAQAGRSGDAIDQEARATRARAVKRRNWERGGPPPPAHTARPLRNAPPRIAPPGRTRSAIAPLPVAALRLPGDAVTALTRLGLRQVGDLAGMPRAALGRRFGADVLLRLDQALGVTAEPLSPARPETRFAVRLGLPEPIGLESDILAALDRLLPALTDRLRRKGRGARRVRLQMFRTDRTMQQIEAGLARASADPDRIRPLLAMQLGDVDAGFGFDMLRLEAPVSEPLHPHQHKGQLAATRQATDRAADRTGALDDLISRLGARIGLDTITRLHPAESHIPEKTAKMLAAAWSEPEHDWPDPPAPRPLLLWRPEPVHARASPTLPLAFRWRRRDFATLRATGPERISPEWWLDDADWRSGVRDYWQVVTGSGERLWLFYAHGGALSPGWFCHGAFA